MNHKQVLYGELAYLVFMIVMIAAICQLALYWSANLL